MPFEVEAAARAAVTQQARAQPEPIRNTQRNPAQKYKLDAATNKLRYHEQDGDVGEQHEQLLRAGGREQAHAEHCTQSHRTEGTAQPPKR